MKIKIKQSMNRKPLLHEAYLDNLKESKGLMKKLQERIDTESKQEITWGHLGDLGRIVEELKDLNFENEGAN